ncbi:MAG: PHP domain-containing protein [Acidimicrobiia bacterium]
MSSDTVAPYTPETALLRVIHCLDRAFDQSPRTRSFLKALAVVRSTDTAELRVRSERHTLTELDGIGDTTAAIISEAIAGAVPAYLTKLERDTAPSMSDGAAVIRDALRGDLHAHSTWSDGGASIEEMATTAKGLGHDYLALTDHSARLTIAHGLDRDRLLRQLDEIAALNERLAPFRILTGLEVDILEDGALDLDDETLGRLDVVVASVHSKLRMERSAMTERMVRAVSSPHVDVLGHCTGRKLVGERRSPVRPASVFDAEFVFAACASGHTAVEINSRPERLDPPLDLLEIAVNSGCLFTISSDAHSTGQLEWQPSGCEIASAGALKAEQILNTWTTAELLAWTGAEPS